MGVCMSSRLHVKGPAKQSPLAGNYRKKDSEVNVVPLERKHQAYDYEEVRYEREKVVIVACPHAGAILPDKVCVVDVDPDSTLYCKVISSFTLPTVGDEVCRMSWSRSASRLEEMTTTLRTHLVLPCMNSSRIYIISVEDILDPRLIKCIDSSSLARRDLSSPYAVRSCPGRGTPLYVSTMGDKNGHAKGDFVQLDRRTFDLREKQPQSSEAGEDHADFGGEFAVQPRHGFLISAEWGHPRLIRNGFLMTDINDGMHSSRNTKKLKQSLTLDPYDGCMMMSVRFLHNPECNHGFACSAIGSAIFHIHMNSQTGELKLDKAVQLPVVEVEGWLSESMPAMITDLVISLDDRFMYVSCWLHGFIAQYDITDPFRITLKAKIFIGGCLHSNSKVKIKRILSESFYPEHHVIKNRPIYGGPNMMQLSLDGRRLYVTTSFYRVWDAQIYPELIERGATMIQIYVNVKEGGLRLNSDFVVDFGRVEGGPFLAREMRIPNGDCTSDSFT